jgi:hypothetical protein
LKPILAHKFWIVFGVALLIPVIGWWLDTGSLKAEIKNRQDKINKAFTDSTVGSDVPNDSWEAALTKINTAQAAQKRASAQRLYDSQKILTVWPEDVRPMMKDLAFRAPIPQRALDIYRNTYFNEVERVRQTVKPYTPDGNGLVVLPEAAVPYIPRSKWEFLPPTPDEMWNAKEDLDLIEGLLKAIVQVNGEAAAINEASIRQIDTIELMGGTLKAAAAGGGGGAGAGAGAGGPMAGGAEGAIPMGGFGGGGGGGAGGKTTTSSTAAFAPSEEFGSQAGSGGGGGGGGGGAPPAAAGAGGPTAGGDASGGGAAPVSRYVDEDPNLPYRRRAFYMKVVMNHQKVPDLIASLASLPWPVEVIRVQQVAKFDDVSGGSGGGAGGALGGAGPGPMGGGGGGFGAAAAGPAVDVGGFGNRPMARPMAAGADGEGAGGQTNDAAKRVYDAAMSDPLLAEVAIAGLMTLYLPPKDTGAPADGQTPPTDPASPTPADPNALPAAEATPATEGTPAPTETPTGDKPSEEKPTADKPAEEKPAAETPATEKPAAPEGTPKPEDASKPPADPKPPAENKPETGK